MSADDIPSKTLLFLTDFGLADHYVGIMKLVARRLCPSVQCVDLCHNIQPQNIASAGYLLATSFDYTPPTGVIVAVVDPGVGSTRRAIAVRCQRRWVICPDNGLISMLLSTHEAEVAVVLDNPTYHLHPTSHTFHGRDIFTACAAHLLAGVNPEQLGTVIDPATLQTNTQHVARIDDKGQQILAHVIHCDHFGNIITSATARDCSQLQNPTPIITLRDIQVPLHQTFADVEINQWVAYVGSFGHIEVAIRQGDAARAMTIRTGEPVHLR